MCYNMQCCHILRIIRFPKKTTFWNQWVSEHWAHRHHLWSHLHLEDLLDFLAGESCWICMWLVHQCSCMSIGMWTSSVAWDTEAESRKPNRTRLLPRGIFERTFKSLEGLYIRNYLVRMRNLARFRETYIQICPWIRHIYNYMRACVCSWIPLQLL